jgi:hypothetical protein
MLTILTVKMIFFIDTVIMTISASNRSRRIRICWKRQVINQYGDNCSMWCRWLSQAKTNKNSYVQEWVDSFKKAITDAFEIGQKYSEDRR